MARLDGRVALVTGAARGIGAAIAARLAAEGARVALTDRADGAASAEAIRAAGGAAVFLAHDTADPAAWDAVVAETTARLGPLDILVNNAGLYDFGPVAELDIAQWRRLAAVNVEGVLLGTRAAFRAMAGRGGSVVNMASTASLVGAAGSAVYSATKGAVRAFSRAAAVEGAAMAPPVRVNIVCPGVIDTAMGGQVADKVRASGGPSDPAAIRRALAARHPLNRMGEAADVAAAVAWLASDDAAFVTGAETVVDGGMTAV